MFVCEYCGKELSSKPNLKTHQTKARYCLEKQNKSIQSAIKCSFCDKEFLHKQKKEMHETKCHVRIENERILEVSELKDEIIRLKNENECLKIEKEKQRAEIYTRTSNIQKSNL